jgi:hypothetical protein
VLAARQKTIQCVLVLGLSSLVLMVCGGIGCLLGGIFGIYLVTVPASTALNGDGDLRAGKMNWPLRPGGAWPKPESKLQIIETAIYTTLPFVPIRDCCCGAITIDYAPGRGSRWTPASRFGNRVVDWRSAGPTNTLYFTPHVNRAIPASEKIKLPATSFPADLCLLSVVVPFLSGVGFACLFELFFPSYPEPCLVAW